jgi:hypothetical protein
MVMCFYVDVPWAGTARRKLGAARRHAAVPCWHDTVANYKRLDSFQPSFACGSLFFEKIDTTK